MLAEDEHMVEFLGEGGWEEITSHLWPYRELDQPAKGHLLYCITSEQIKAPEDIVYIGKQGKSERVRNFVQAYLAFLELRLKILSKNSELDKNQMLSGKQYGKKEFKFGSALSHDLIPILTLYSYCKKNNVEFEELQFRFFVKKDNDPKDKELLKKYKEKYPALKRPPANTQ